ncbi:hypothetical protein CH367_01770 [Leptospira barantonii]|uniref:Uncharacterized protein n=1 Tax=Leptospira barantonii TaxID=2023184 RepID=A0ABX4NT58_9LEPT|nr:hypothetical protein CH367_01770 [Leptospira barantonii]
MTDFPKYRRGDLPFFQFISESSHVWFLKSETLFTESFSILKNKYILFFEYTIFSIKFPEGKTVIRSFLRDIDPKKKDTL